MDSDVASPLPVPKVLAKVRISVEVRIEEFLQQEIVRWREIDSDLEVPLTVLRDFVASGGKRLRPAFCYWSFVGAGGDPDDPAVIDVGASLEMLHTFAQESARPQSGIRRASLRARMWLPDQALRPN